MNVTANFRFGIPFSERRVIYDYEKFGDSPVCLGEIGKDGISGQIGVSEGRNQY